jgi:DNA helicase II / ATP-dependent DNA helicase PcrA
VTVPGPRALGRGVIVAAGEGAPPAWSSAPSVTVDEAALVDPTAVVDRLVEAWATRKPVVIELAVDPATFRAPRSYGEDDIGPTWLLDPGFTPAYDRLHFLVWANTYDARGGGEPVWWWARKAARLGAAAASSDTAADILLPDGTLAWVDGGPRGAVADVDGTSVVHAESVEAGRLVPVPPERPPTSDLAPDQLAAVTHGSGPARVIAPAGSGKTRVLTERLRHLVVDRGYEPASVVAVAYNRKARDEMVARTSGVGGRILTLNALGYEIVAAGLGRRPEVLEVRDVRRLLEPLVPRGARRLNTDPLAPYVEALSAVRLSRSRTTGATCPAWPRHSPPTGLPCPGAGRSTSTSRCCWPSSCCSGMASSAVPSRPATVTCWSMSSRTSRPPTCCCCGCWPRPRSTCSAWAMTTR